MMNYEDKIIIETIELDEIITESKFDKIKLIKIDAEGSEPEVLLGLKKNFSKVEYITIDVSAERGKNKSFTICECVNILNKYNFEFKDFFMENSSKERMVILFKNINLD